MGFDDKVLTFLFYLILLLSIFIIIGSFIIVIKIILMFVSSFTFWGITFTGSF